MRIAACLLVVVVVGAIALADPATGTVVISCNEAEAALIVDGVLIPERTPAVLTLPAGTHLIEARKPPLVTQKKVVEVAAQQQIKVRFDLIAPAPPAPPPGPDVPVGSGSAAPPATGSGAPPATGSAQVSATGSAGPIAAGSAAPPVGSAAPPASAPVVPPPRCRQGGREVPCPPEGPRCTMGGKPVSCTKGTPLPPPAPPAPAIAAGSGVGSSAPTAPTEPHVPGNVAAIEIATTVPHAIAYVDGAPVRDAPCLLELEPGEHVIAVYAAGMVPAEAIVRAEVSKRQRLELVPSKPRQRTDVPAP